MKALLHCSGHTQQLSSAKEVRIPCSSSQFEVVCVAGVPYSLFGFEGKQLVGKPLSSTIDVFTDWKEGHGEELSLLELLVAQLATSTADGAAGQSSAACGSWRVGVHRPEVQSQSSLVSLGAPLAGSWAL
jgi:hypothetical protein